MSKTYIVSRNGGTVTKAPINDNKIPIYANETALDADLANIPDNTLVATRGGHDDVIDQMKEYIRKQNVLSDWEDCDLVNNVDKTMRYDGILMITCDLDTNFSIYVNGVLVINPGGRSKWCNSWCTIDFKKGDEIKIVVTNGTITNQKVGYYKLRDYTGR